LFSLGEFNSRCGILAVSNLAIMYESIFTALSA